jgi:predicted phosphodiesterase
MVGPDKRPSDAAVADEAAGSATAEPVAQANARSLSEQQAPSSSDIAQIRIAHLSDLHFGRGFNQTLWSNLSRIVRKANPHLIVVTGDLVNSPFRWTLRRARTALEELARSVRPEAGSPLSNLVIVPGNHDVRVAGIFPVKWINWLVPVIGLFLYGALSLTMAKSFEWKLIVSLSTVAALLLARFSFFRSFAAAFDSYVLTRPTHWTDLGLAIYPFDSASRGVQWARGQIGEAQFDQAQEQPKLCTLVNRHGAPRQSVADPRYRIALLHHHPLPIPYDSGQEPLMVMEDAGAFLSEISNQRIPLVLHGHKHHRHFSRVTINAGETMEFEASVLATGTATAGQRPGRFGFNFNLLSIEADGNARVLPYVTSGGTFKAAEAFWAQEPEESARRTFTTAAAQRGFSGRTLMALMDINSDGDSLHVYECWGFSVSEGAPELSELPFQVRAGVSVGVGRVERFDAQPLRPNLAAGLRLRPGTPHDSREQAGTIEFGRTLTCQGPPLNFSWSYHGINSYAMSEQQYYEMYGDDRAPTESAMVTIRHCPFAELVMIVNFPADFAMEGEPELLISDISSGASASPVTDRLRNNLFYSRQINVLFLRIPHPPLGLKYEVRWRLTGEAPPSGDTASEGAAHELSEWLLGRSVPTPFEDPLRKLLQAVEAIARTHFELGSSAQDPLDLDLMVYDRSRQLRVVAATFPVEDKRWALRLPFGAGIAGRAYKRRKTRLFVKQRAVVEGAPFYFVPADGAVVSSKGDEIAEEVVLSFPLSHPKQPEAVYAVLSLSSRNRGSKLVNLTEEALATKFEQFRRAVVESCFEAIRQAMLDFR